MKSLEFELQNLANKLRAMWGNNPDSDLIEQGIKELYDLKTKVAEVAPKQRKTKQ